MGGGPVYDDGDKKVDGGSLAQNAAVTVPEASSSSDEETIRDRKTIQASVRSEPAAIPSQLPPRTTGAFPWFCVGVCLIPFLACLVAMAKQQAQIAELQSMHVQEEGRMARRFLNAEMTRHRVMVKDMEFFIFGDHAYRFHNSCMSHVEARYLAGLSSLDLPDYERASG